MKKITMNSRFVFTALLLSLFVIPLCVSAQKNIEWGDPVELKFVPFKKEKWPDFSKLPGFTPKHAAKRKIKIGRYGVYAFKFPFSDISYEMTATPMKKALKTVVIDSNHDKKFKKKDTVVKLNRLDPRNGKTSKVMSWGPIPLKAKYDGKRGLKLPVLFDLPEPLTIGGGRKPILALGPFRVFVAGAYEGTFDGMKIQVIDRNGDGIFNTKGNNRLASDLLVADGLAMCYSIQTIKGSPLKIKDKFYFIKISKDGTQIWFAPYKGPVAQLDLVKEFIPTAEGTVLESVIIRRCGIHHRRVKDEKTGKITNSKNKMLWDYKDMLPMEAISKNGASGDFLQGMYRITKITIQRGKKKAMALFKKASPGQDEIKQAGSFNLIANKKTSFKFGGPVKASFRVFFSEDGIFPGKIKFEGIAGGLYMPAIKAPESSLPKLTYYVNGKAVFSEYVKSTDVGMSTPGGYEKKIGNKTAKVVLEWLDSPIGDISLTRSN